MRLFIFLLSVFVSLNAIQAQTFDLILPGYVNNYETKSKLLGVSLYVVQDGKTISKAITNSVGVYSISAKVNKNIPFEIIASKPNYLSKRIYFDFKALKVRGNSAVIQAAEELLIQLFEVRQGVTIPVGPNDYAEKFLWDDNQNIMIPDLAYNKLADEKIIKAFKDFELQALVSKFMTKSESFAQVKNYEKAISYCDSALVLNNKDSIVIKKKVAFKNSLDAVIADEKKQEEMRLALGSSKLKFYIGRPSVEDSDRDNTSIRISTPWEVVEIDKEGKTSYSEDGVIDCYFEVYNAQVMSGKYILRFDAEIIPYNTDQNIVKKSTYTKTLILDEDRQSDPEYVLRRTSDLLDNLNKEFYYTIYKELSEDEFLLDRYPPTKSKTYTMSKYTFTGKGALTKAFMEYLKNIPEGKVGNKNEFLTQIGRRSGPGQYSSFFSASNMAGISARQGKSGLVKGPNFDKFYKKIFE